MTDRVFLTARGREFLPAATEYVAALTFDYPSIPAAVVDDADWLAAFREAVGIHGVGPYLGLRVEAGEVDAPLPVAAWLRTQVGRNRARLLRLRSELDAVLASFRRSNIEVIPLKGAALLLGDPASPEGLIWRSVGDLDLLVPEPQGNRRHLDLALAHAGYCLKSASWKHRHYSACAPGPPIVVNDGEHPDNPRDVEVHDAVVEMFRGFRWDLTPWILARTGVRCGVRVPDDEGMALHLAVHASLAILEGTMRAIQLIDLTRILVWSGAESLILAVNNAGIDSHARFVYPSVALSARETGNAHCSEIADALRPHVSPHMRAWIDEVLLHEVSWAGRYERRALDRVALWARTPADRARMVASTLLPTPSVLASESAGIAGPVQVARAYPRYYRHLVSRFVQR